MNRNHRIGDRELGIAGFEVITFGNSEIDLLCSPYRLPKAVFFRSASIISKNSISIHRQDFCAFEVEAKEHFLQTLAAYCLLQAHEAVRMPRFLV
jgi:hypothetical protein